MESRCVNFHDTELQTAGQHMYEGVPKWFTFKILPTEGLKTMKSVSTSKWTHDCAARIFPTRDSSLTFWRL